MKWTWSIALLAVGCGAPSDPPTVSTPEPAPAPTKHPITAEEVIAKYATFQRVTPRQFYVNPALSALCRGPSPDEIAEARIKHGIHAVTAIHVFMNDAAEAAFVKASGDYPEGSVVVKEKWGGLGIGGMIKRHAGYDPLNGNWEYLYFEKGSPLQSGKIQSCGNCHSTTRKTDHVFGTWKNP